MKRGLWNILPRSYRRRTIGVVVTIFLRAVLNFAGVATLLPVLMLILNRDNLESSEPLMWLYQLLGCSSYTNFVMVICALVIMAILIKNVAILGLYRYERDFIYSLYKHLSENLYRYYYNRGLSYIKHSNSALLTRNVNSISLMFVAGVLKPVAAIIGEGLLMALILGALVWYKPITALLILLIFLPIVAIFYLVTRRQLHNIGERENSMQRLKSRIVSDTFRGYADVEIGGAFSFMLKRFDDAINDIVALRKRHATLSMLPQMFAEVGLAVGLSALVIMSIVQSGDDIALLFGFFAIAAVRLIPSLRSIMSSWSTIRFNRHSIDTLGEAVDEDFSEELSAAAKPMELHDKIEIRDLTFCFEDATEPVIKEFSLNIMRGERVGIRGSSGIGKTTLLNLILGLYRPTSGGIYIDGNILNKENIRSWHRSIGYVPQTVFIADISLAENIAFGHTADDIDYELLSRVIKLADLEEFVSSLPEGVNTHIGEQGSRLSGGQRQRVGIARALYKRADILLFDEATSSLDGKTEENINSAIRRLSTEDKSLTIIVIAHRESSLEYCDKIITLGEN
ncbi:MAG: ABC transporter ATP-binding protein [Rikenellaceae bacterium]|nr:ABC transporter ATP-binding protein [Rikenellaceae bacterium]